MNRVLSDWEHPVSPSAIMGLSKADEQKAVAAAKNEISAFSDMYNRCGMRHRCGAPPVAARPCQRLRSSGLTDHR